MRNPKLLFRVHAVQRMFERGISPKNIRNAIENGETIEDYSFEMPDPSRLILGFQGRRAFHVVTSESWEENVITVVTVYKPYPEKWSRDFKRRRS